MTLLNHRWFIGLLLCLAAANSSANPYPPLNQNLPPLVLKSHGIFWAGGEIVNRTQAGTLNVGDLKNVAYNQQQTLVGQAYVEYFIPAKLRHGKNTLPIVMVPGGALVGVHFLTTPDGREGWAHYFLRRGFPVYIVDVPGRGRAGFMPDPYNDVKAGVAPPNSQPVIRGWDSSAWLEWNTGPLPDPRPAHGPNDPNCIGNDARDPKNPPIYCNGNLMPALDSEGYKHWLGALVPEGPVPGGSDPGLLAVMKKVGPAIWLGHSQAGTTGGRLSNENPEVFKAVIGIEPAQNCNLPATAEIKGIAKVPQFSIHGINQVGRPETGPCVDTYGKIKAAGGDATYLSLPKLPKTPLFDRIPQAGIWGNDHILMWNTNSDQIAGLVLKWIEKHIEKKKVKLPW